MNIAKQLEEYTAVNSRFETKRDYISLSHMHLSAEEILDKYYNGFEDSPEIRLRCYKGYQMEDDVIRRLKVLYNGRIDTEVTIFDFDGKVQGHPDFTIGNVVADIKSVPLDEHLPDKRVPRKVWWQMQAYLLFGEWENALVLYESRETGKFKEFWLNPHPGTQAKIKDKINWVFNMILQNNGGW